MTPQEHATLVQALQDPALYPHPVAGFEVLETHISSVILAGDYAYKVKKPLDLGFLDFSTRERRGRFCHEEVRLNRRLAPELYLEVVPLTGSPEQPRLGGDGEPFEYAVKMRRFRQEDLLDRVLERGELGPGRIDELADIVADFHGRVPAAGADTDFGRPEVVHFPVAQNFDQIRPLLEDADDLRRLERLRKWAATRYATLREALAARKAAGFVRECHGDLHLGNMALVEDRITLFDCIEFNDHLRWIDVMSEAAFLAMDLEDRGRPDYAWRFLNAYLAETGDYPGLTVLRYYQAYRAMVRAKVSVIRLGQPGLAAEERARAQAAYRGYAALAERYARPPRPVLVITHGVSGSGKTVVSGAVAEAAGMVRLRSDVERKRLHGLAAAERSDSAVGGGLYTAETTRATYERLAGLAADALAAGHPVLVDATFLDADWRRRFRELARERDVPFAILGCRARESTLRRRVSERAAEGSDASEAGLEVLEHQLATAAALGEQERPALVQVDAERPVDAAALVEALERVTGPIG